MSAAGKGAAAGLRRLVHPSTWPVRWRLTAVSAGLTLVILMLFGGAIGKIATQRISDDFSNEVENPVHILASDVEIRNPLIGPPEAVGSPQLKYLVQLDGASVRFYNFNLEVIGGTGNAGAMGPPKLGLHDHDGMRIATEPIYGGEQTVAGYVQYGRSLEHVNDTIARVWLLIVGGIIGGTLLAIFAGVAIAGRAMRPISALTSSARQIATTRDPSQHMPAPKVDDEVGELAETLEQMLRSLDEARAEREGAMQKQREFVADASHELRTPLTSVLANLELLQASLGSADQAEDREIVDSALRSSKRMGRLVGDLLLLARADAGRLAPHRRCDLAEIAGEAAAEAAPLMGGREFHIDNDHPLRVEGSPDELHRLVLNLLDNAARHTPAGATIELGLREDGADALVEVADDGPGIPTALRTQIFERFVRGEGPSDTQRGTGTGLGLAIVSAVAASHGGSVEATESPAGGALFRARIPMAQPDRAPTPGSPQRI